MYLQIDRLAGVNDPISDGSAVNDSSEHVYKNRFNLIILCYDAECLLHLKFNKLLIFKNYDLTNWQAHFHLFEPTDLPLPNTLYPTLRIKKSSSFISNIESVIVSSPSWILHPTRCYMLVFLLFITCFSWKSTPTRCYL